MTKHLTLIVTLLLLVPGTTLANGIIQSHPKFCKPGLQSQSNGPFAVMLFCEDALASHIGVVYEKTMGAPLDGNWNISDRFWQNPEWAADVTGYFWSKSGKELLIATSPIYGTGSVIKLNLMERTHKKVFDLSAYSQLKGLETCMLEMVAVTEESKTIELQLEDCGQKILGNIQISY